jgi:hypothetical protein
MKLLIMQFPSVSRHFIPPRSKYSPQHPVLKHPQLSGIQASETLIQSTNVSNITFNILTKLLKDKFAMRTRSREVTLPTANNSATSRPP